MPRGLSRGTANPGAGAAGVTLLLPALQPPARLPSEGCERAVTGHALPPRWLGEPSQLRNPRFAPVSGAPGGTPGLAPAAAPRFPAAATRGLRGGRTPAGPGRGWGIPRGGGPGDAAGSRGRQRAAVTSRGPRSGRAARGTAQRRDPGPERGNGGREVEATGPGSSPAYPPPGSRCRTPGPSRCRDSRLDAPGGAEGGGGCPVKPGRVLAPGVPAAPPWSPGPAATPRGCSAARSCGSRDTEASARGLLRCPGRAGTLMRTNGGGITGGV